MAAATNEIAHQKFSAWTILIHQFRNPLLLLFLFSTVVSFLIGLHTEALVIWSIMTLSIVLGFVNEYQAGRIVRDLMKRISVTATVIRNGKKAEVPVRNIKVGDEVSLFPGSIVPADIKLKDADGLEVNESVLTGETLPSGKAKEDMVLMGTVVTGGVGMGEVIAIGTDTKFGSLSKDVVNIRPETEFEKGLKSFSALLAKIAVVAVLAIIIFNFFLGREMVNTILFALIVAMGITPELLPLIVSISLAYGAKRLAKKGVVVKQFVSIADLGNLEVLCTDKTGTLTEGKIVLDAYLNTAGEVDEKVLKYALICNSIFVHKQVIRDSIDKTIWESAQGKREILIKEYKKMYQIPFNFENRFMTIVVEKGKTKSIICKGSPEAILANCGEAPAERRRIEKLVDDTQRKGFRVIGIASKEIESFDKEKIGEKIHNLKFEGIISFSDEPKKDLAKVFEKFEKLKVKVKILTGDNERIAEKVARDVGFSYEGVLTGPQIEKMTQTEFEKAVPKTTIFARVTPSQKTRIIKALNVGDHTVGYLGDGVNDAPALHSADVGISVNSGVDVAKDAASIVLLRKGLTEIAYGINEGRVTFNNTIKYILMGTSSNFGNMVSAAVASIVLPFLPMAPVQALTEDILYDLSQLTIPTDSVDDDQIVRPKRWDLKYIKKFMWVFGPISTAYDFLTFGVMYFLFGARGNFFQTGWFVESLVTEILVVFVIRTRKIPFFRSLPSWQLILTCIVVVAAGLYFPFSPLAAYLDFTPLPKLYFLFLLGVSITYLIFVEIGKFFLNKGRFE